MKPKDVKFALLVAVCAAALGVGLINALLLKEVPIVLIEENGLIIVAQIDADYANRENSAKQGDVVSEIGGREVHSHADARWLLDRTRSGDHVEMTVRRNGSDLGVYVSANRPYPAIHILVNILAGCVFLFIGLFVWKFGQNDSIVKAFLRLNLLTGIAILLDSQRSVFELEAFHIVYSLCWLACYLLIPASCLDFVLRFSYKGFASRARNSLLVYAPLVLLFIAIGSLLIGEASNESSQTIHYMDFGMRIVYGAILVLYLSASLLLLLYTWMRAGRIEERISSRWLVLCTLVGVVPFVMLHKLPTLWGSAPLISVDLAMVFLMISPIGWGMAVSSFRLLPIEQTLSRTFIYTASGAIAVYGVLILISFGLGGKEYDPYSVTALLFAAVFITFLAGFSLVKGIRGVVDRIYFGDWYDYRRAVQHLTQRLSGSIIERDISAILTEELTEILRIEKAILLRKGDAQSWIPLMQRDMPRAAEFGDALKEVDSLIENGNTADKIYSVPEGSQLAVWGVHLTVPLIHAGRIMGCLLLGRKESHAPYSIRDLQLIHTLSPFAGLSLANLELHRELVERECRAVAADLAGGISHEINNALHPLKGQAQLLQHMLGGPSAPSNQEQLDSTVKMIIDMSNRIQRIADNLNHLSEPARPNKLPVNLNRVADETIVILSETAGRIKRFKSDDLKAPFQLRREYSENLPEVMADLGQLNQVFINLMINAADAMEKLDRGVLTVGTFQNEDKLSISGYVEDSGIGIAPERIKDITKPYFTTKEEGKGTGLGLAIVQAIIESHGGKLNIQSVPGKGTRVEFAIPINSQPLT